MGWWSSPSIVAVPPEEKEISHDASMLSGRISTEASEIAPIDNVMLSPFLTDEGYATALPET